MEARQRYKSFGGSFWREILKKGAGDPKNREKEERKACQGEHDVLVKALTQGTSSPPWEPLRTSRFPG